MDRPELGTWHTIKNQAVKTRKHWKTKWVDCEADEIKGMYIGWRTKFNGSIEQDDWDSPRYFIPAESFEMWLFVTHERQNPIEVFPFENNK